MIDIESHYRANRQAILKRLIKRIGNPWAAEDIVQTAYERAIRYQASCRENDFERWLSEIIKNCVKQYYNDERGYSGNIEHEDKPTTEGCPSYPAKLLKEIYELIQSKPSPQSDILFLHFKYDYSASDIAKLLPLTYAQIHKTISRFRFELKEIY